MILTFHVILDISRDIGPVKQIVETFTLFELGVSDDRGGRWMVNRRAASTNSNLELPKIGNMS